jgi:hypothetical protein
MSGWQWNSFGAERFPIIEMHEVSLMLTDKETRFLEAGLLLAVPVCVAITALLALMTLGA